MTVASAPKAFHVTAKPSGFACDPHCDYSFFLEKAKLYPEGHFRITDEVHEAFIRQLLQSHNAPGANVAWRGGGEPTLMGLGFFRRSLELQRKYRKPGVRMENPFQTNDILRDDEWCVFFVKTTSWSTSAWMVPPSIVLVDTGVASAVARGTLRNDIYAFVFGQKGLMAGVGLQGSKISRIRP